MSNTQNIFEMLSDNESGDERPQKTEKRIRTRGGKKAPETSNYENDSKAKKAVDTKHKRDYKRNTGVSARNRSKDRHSGTGYSGVQRNNFRKRGHGSGNVGTVKDEFQGRTQNREEVEEVEESEEEVEDDKLTVEQYFQQKGANLDDVMEGQKAERKVGQVDQQALKKDKLEVVQKKPELEARIATKSAKSEYKPQYQGELTELLNFRTGFVVDKKKKRTAPKPEVAEEGEKAAEQPKEGEEAEKATEQPKEEKRRPKNDSNRGNKPRRDNRDNRDNRKFDNKRSNKGKGYNVENDQDFPSL